MKKALLLVNVVTLLSFKAPGQNNNFLGAPHINKPSVVGNYPGTSFLFAVTTSGQRPIKWSASGLQKGLDLDKNTGFITKIAKEKGDYKVKISATNNLLNH